MTRMTARRKKTRPERLYTMAEVVEMETEDSVITVTHYFHPTWASLFLLPKF